MNVRLGEELVTPEGGQAFPLANQSPAPKTTIRSFDLVVVSESASVPPGPTSFVSIEFDAVPSTANEAEGVGSDLGLAEGVATAVRRATAWEARSERGVDESGDGVPTPALGTGRTWGEEVGWGREEGAASTGAFSVGLAPRPREITPWPNSPLALTSMAGVGRDPAAARSITSRGDVVGKGIPLLGGGVPVTNAVVGRTMTSTKTKARSQERRSGC